MEDFHSLSNRISGLQEDIFAVKKQTSVLASDIKEDDRKLEELNNRIKSLFDKAGIDESNISSESTIDDIQQINTEIDSILSVSYTHLDVYKRQCFTYNYSFFV